MLCAQQHRWVVMRHSACFFFFFFFITKKICRAVSGTAKSPRSATTNCAPAMWMSETLYWGECSTSSLNENTTFSHRQLQQVQIQIRHNTQQERKGHLKHNKSATNWTTWLLKKKIMNGLVAFEGESLPVKRTWQSADGADEKASRSTLGNHFIPRQWGCLSFPNARLLLCENLN